MVKVYEINSIFYAKVEECKEINEILIYLKIRQKPTCMFFTVKRNDETAVLDYFPECTADKLIIKSAIAFIFKKFKWIKFIELTDKSQFNCDGYLVKTSDMSFLINKKTWYEKHFNARPNFNGYELLKEAISQKPNFHFKKIWKYHFENQKEQMYAKDYNYYKNMYNNSRSYFDFF